MTSMTRCLFAYTNTERKDHALFISKEQGFVLMRPDQNKQYWDLCIKRRVS